MEIKFLKQIEIQMGAETQFSVLMGVNHIKLFIRYFFLQSHTAVLDPHPHWEKQLDPVPQKMNAEQQPQP